MKHIDLAKSMLPEIFTIEYTADGNTWSRHIDSDGTVEYFKTPSDAERTAKLKHWDAKEVWIIKNIIQKKLTSGDLHP